MTEMTQTRRPRNRRPLRLSLLAGAAMLTLAGCQGLGNFDPDLRGYGNSGLDTAAAAKNATAARPTPDARGIISYPTYQVAVAKKGDTVSTLAARIGTDAGALARYNAIKPDAVLRKGEILALPSRVAEPAGAATATTAAPSAITTESIDITSLASGAIDRAEANQPKATATASQTQTAAAAPVAGKPTGAEPTRHQVQRGETAYSIARYYNVSVRALADWNGLPADMSVREGQFLMIPVANTSAPVKTAAAAPAVSEPGEGTATPTPPSAAKPLPAEVPPKASEPVKTTAAPDLSQQVTKTSGGQLAMPVSGSIIRAFTKGKNDGIDIAASAGTAVKAAGDGKVLLISKNTDQVAFLALRHDNGLVTIYQNVTGITVEKGAAVKRGQTIATVANATPAALHFEVRKGIDPVDPMPYLQ